MTDDTISRQAAIAYAISGRVRTLPTAEDGENWIRTAEVRQNLLTMPSAERWIPCEVRLPKPNQLVGHVTKYYLIQDEFGDMMVASYQSNERGETWWEQMNSFHAIQDEIVAWQELPKPWKGENND